MCVCVCVCVCVFVYGEDNNNTAKAKNKHAGSRQSRTPTKQMLSLQNRYMQRARETDYKANDEGEHKSARA